MLTPETPTEIKFRLLVEPDRTVWIRTDATPEEIQFAKELENNMALTNADAKIDDQFVDNVWLSTQEADPWLSDGLYWDSDEYDETDEYDDDDDDN